MSNSQVGAVYQQIINDVIAASRVDFEEGGIDEAVLEQLRQVSKMIMILYLSFHHFPRSHLRPRPPVPSKTSSLFFSYRNQIILNAQI
jgi:hypothetical protein